ncbi:ATP-binding protein [Dongia soli]|uniref:histidine kinase n=1 Tax=Dongia soli TaxID=600628 RepID=A0ABU5E9D0_9PROT|nr:ATP-binding protein [Dongia soli]MDY0882839.1 ATP-binding protein [Dongia soli]
MFCVLVASGPATVGFYLFSRETTIEDAAQLISVIASNKTRLLDAELSLARRSLETFRDHLIANLAAPLTPEEDAKFSTVFRRQPNGMITSDPAHFDGRTEAGVFLHPTTELTPLMKALHLRGPNLMTVYGSAIVPPFDSLWLLTRQRSEIVYMPRVPSFIYQAQVTDDYSGTEWVMLGDPATNPDRGLRWTQTTYDFVAWSWMVSAVLPIDINGTWLGTIGHDIFIRNLLDQLTENDRFKDTEHFLIDKTGQPVLAGHWQAGLEAGTLTLADKVAMGKVISTLQRYAPAQTGIANSYRFSVAGIKSVIVSIRIAETGWSYYRVVPIASIVGRVTSAFLWTMAIAFAAMLLITVALHTALRMSIVQPLRELASIVQSFAIGQTNIRAPVRTNDEIGHLGTAFNAMADRIHQSHAKLNQAQQDLLRQNRDLQRASRIKSNFLANMSHELRTPLNAIIGFTDVMQTELFGPLGNARYREYTMDIKRSGQHLLALINDILDMSRIEAGKADFDMAIRKLNSIIESCVSMISATASEKGITIEVSLPEAPLLARCDLRAVTQMLLNLLSNAIKFSPPDGRIFISARPTDKGGSEIAVRDQGPGIANAVLPHLFEPFSPKMADITSSLQGAGLGLSITKGLIEAHGGSITVETINTQMIAHGVPDEGIRETGTTMRLIFPAADV